MNNNQFRRLVADKPKDQDEASSTSRTGATPSALGTKKSGFMPMTPRTVKGGIDVDFARQVRERNAAFQPTKKFKSAAPKGVKYAAGYTDRAKARAEAGDEHGAAGEGARIKALEEQMKLGQISEAMFLALRDEITGGDIGSTHLVKGLDRKLLERVRRGEDVLGVGGADGETPADVDEELDKLGEKEVETVVKEKADKKGTMAPPPPISGVKRSRDAIMAELKAQRKAKAEAKAAEAPVLDSRWRKVGEEKNTIKIDHKGREVLITVDEDGVVKKKVRKVAPKTNGEDNNLMDMPNPSKPVLGSDAIIPKSPKEVKPEEVPDEEDDIFEGVGTEYDPLGGEEEYESSASDEDDERAIDLQANEPATFKKQDSASTPSESSGDEKPPKDPPTAVPPTAAPRNYFKDASTTSSETTADRFAGVQEFIKRAAKLDSTRSADQPDDGVDNDNGNREARLKKRAQMLAQQDRDLDDIDMGFGESRFEDGEDEAEGKVKLSEWKGADLNGGYEEGKGAARDKKKRKPKKRKGDANNMSDILRVIDGRKGGGG